ncbi:UDP-glucuronosyltransferase 1-1 [Striga asiatica]|uniref:UDP-glucuronosyltransferase 1-1 n=1 Tax=Striga asiatica TaxID=4170 RepID=A0A5A7QKX7_STRAF|nr:UDP-glucuronosyltransferase 1-1 [Striga asiatica]
MLPVFGKEIGNMGRTDGKSITASLRRMGPELLANETDDVVIDPSEPEDETRSSHGKRRKKGRDDHRACPKEVPDGCTRRNRATRRHATRVDRVTRHAGPRRARQGRAKEGTHEWTPWPDDECTAGNSRLKAEKDAKGAYARDAKGEHARGAIGDAWGADARDTANERESSED